MAKSPTSSDATLASDDAASNALASDALAMDATDPVNLENMVDITKLNATKYPIVVVYTNGDTTASGMDGNTYTLTERGWVCDNNPDLVCSTSICSIWGWDPYRDSEHKGWPAPWPIPEENSSEYGPYMEKHEDEMAFRVDCVKSECFTTAQVRRSEKIYDDDYDTYTHFFRGVVWVNGTETAFNVEMSLCSAALGDCEIVFSSIKFNGFDDDIDWFDPSDMCVRAVRHDEYAHSKSVWKLGPRAAEWGLSD
jgi:hypothetical protein